MTTQFEKDMQSPNRELFLKVRELLLKVDGIEETQKPRITTFSNAKGGICHLRTMPHGVDVGFLKGAKMTDAVGRLTGTGKAIRVLELSCFEEDVCAYYLRQAIELNR
ncbi:hypothetical protein [uncultured Litoreibacter sp.]|uniref:hypothetical protein n=1 Tax=uncultured Litoreibacter sp. TaxID=1392394 RepID=UPI00260E41A8|nr:hypothetical protein [uncultured Litoreibacter sp.]